MIFFLYYITSGTVLALYNMGKIFTSITFNFVVLNKFIGKSLKTHVYLQAFF